MSIDIDFFSAPIFGEILAEAPAKAAEAAAPDAVNCALDMQGALLEAGFSPRYAFAAAVETLAHERPCVANKSGKARPISQKFQRRLKAWAAEILVEEQGRAS